MEGVLVALAILACPVGMGLMMLFMAKGVRGGTRPEPTETEDLPGELGDLRDEHRRLGEQIEHLEGRRAPDSELDSARR